MANMKTIVFLFSTLFLFSAFHQFKADDSHVDELELDQLKAKHSIHESELEEKLRELRTKDEIIKQMENIIQEKSAAIVSLQNDMQAVQAKGSVDDQVGKAQARINELETQVAYLKKETESLSQKRDVLESRASIAEKKVSDLNLKLESLTKTRDEQKIKIRKIERALQVAEEKVSKAKLQESKILKELKEAQQSWVPHWLSIHFFRLKSILSTQWEDRGRPALDATLKKALQKKAEVQKWAKPHVKAMKTKWIPVVKDQSAKLVAQIRPGVKLLTTKTSEVYNASKRSIRPHVVKLQERVDPYFQEVNKVTKPYVDQVVTAAKPHVESVRVFLKPYTKKITHGYRKFHKAYALYNLQLQTAIKEILRNNELTKPFATDKNVWYLASALMALLIFFLYNLVSSIFRKKPKRRSRNSHTGHRHRRAKRVHVEN